MKNFFSASAKMENDKPTVAQTIEEEEMAEDEVVFSKTQILWI